MATEDPPSTGQLFAEYRDVLLRLGAMQSEHLHPSQVKPLARRADDLEAELSRRCGW